MSNLETKWFIAILLGFLFILVWFFIRDTKRFFILVMIIGIPINLQINIIARDYLGSINGIFLNLVDISVFGLIILWILRSLLHKESIDLKIYFFPKISYPAIFIILVGVLSLLVSYDKHGVYMG